MFFTAFYKMNGLISLTGNLYFPVFSEKVRSWQIFCGNDYISQRAKWEMEAHVWWINWYWFQIKMYLYIYISIYLYLSIIYTYLHIYLPIYHLSIYIFIWKQNEFMCVYSHQWNKCWVKLLMWSNLQIYTFFSILQLLYKVPQTEWLTTTEIHFLIVLEARNLKSRGHQGAALSWKL